MIITKNDLQTLAVELFNVGVIKTGSPRARTPIYIDLQQLLAHPKLLARVSTMLWLLTDPNEKYDRICGVPFNALSRCGVPYHAITYAYELFRQTKIPMLMRPRSLTVTSNAIEGQFQIGDRVVIVDDEIASGNSILEITVDLLKEKLKIGGALVVIDRERGGREHLENAGVEVKSLFKITELIDYLRNAGKIVDHRRGAIKTDSNVVEFTKQMPAYMNDRNTRRRGFA